MEIQIPVADLDTGTEDFLSDRTGQHTLSISEAWSIEGQGHSALFTARTNSTLPEKAADSDTSVGKERPGEEDDGLTSSSTKLNVYDKGGTDSNLGSREVVEKCGSGEVRMSEDVTTTAGEDGKEVTLESPSAESLQSENEHVDSEGLKMSGGEAGELQQEQESAGFKPAEGSGERDPETNCIEAELHNAELGEQKEESDDAESGIDADGEEYPEDTSEGKGEDAPINADEGEGSDSSPTPKTDVLESEGITEGFEANTEEAESPPTPKDGGTAESSADSQVGGAQEGMGGEKGVFLTEREPPDEDGSDISGVRAETPDLEEEGEAASVSDVGEANTRGGLASSGGRRPLTRSTVQDDIPAGQRAVVNTPVSYLTDYHPDLGRNLESRNTSHAGVESAREAVFQRAMTLMSDRCTSSQRDRAQGAHYGLAPDAAFGPKCPQYFFVNQSKPAPMAPLKAWRGYHGNVYFEPMQIRKVGDKSSKDSPQRAVATPSTLSQKSAGQRRRITMSASTSKTVVPVSTQGDADSLVTGDTSSQSRSMMQLKRGAVSAKSRASSRSVGSVSKHNVLYLDRQVVLRPNNPAMAEELSVMERQQATGSLNLTQRPPGQNGHAHNPAHNPHHANRTTHSAGPVHPLYGKENQAGGQVQGQSQGRMGSRRSGAHSAKFDRICRGSVVHRLRRAKSGGPLGNPPRTDALTQSQVGSRAMALTAGESLMVVGDRFTPASVMSPLLRTQTQFSFSGQRMPANSPDLYGAFDRLPPLEQVRVTLRHMDDGMAARVSSPYSGVTSVVGGVEDLNPLLKYSPDVKARLGKQVK